MSHSPDARVVTPRHQIVPVRMEVYAADALHVSVEGRVAVAVVQIPFLDDAVLVGRVDVVVGVCELDAFDPRVVTVE